MTTRNEAVESCIQALRTGESSAGARAARYLAPDVVWVSGSQQVTGYQEVSRRFMGEWPLTPVYARSAWSDPLAEGDRLKVNAQVGPLGAAPAEFNFAFSFDESQLISRIEQETVALPPPTVTDRIPDFVKGIVNNALANGYPMVIGCNDEHGNPYLTLRGATQVFSDTQLSVWLRHAEGDTVKGLQRNPHMMAVYRDSSTRTTLMFRGRGHISTNEDIRNRAYELAPEVEQNHDPDRLGAALIIDIDELNGLTVKGSIRMRRKG